MAAVWKAYLVLQDKFEKACSQLKILDEKIAQTQIRYDRAAAADRRSFRYNIRIQLVELEAVRNAYYQYARASAEELDQMKIQILAVLSD